MTVDELVRRLGPTLERIAQRLLECQAEALRGGGGNAHLEIHLHVRRGVVAEVRRDLDEVDRPA